MTRTVLVTGGAGAIGSAVMERFATGGDTVVGLDARTAPDVVACDITDEYSVEAVFAQVQSQHGPVDVLVNAAGVTGKGNVLEESPAEWRRILDVNLTGAFLCARAALDDMVQSGGGNIVNIASVNGRFGGSALSGPAYAASKGGLITLTRFIAREHAAAGVRTNAVAPGPHETPMWQALDEDKRRAILSTLPGGGIGDAEDLAGVVTFLCSDEARYINGATIDINGGQWMG
jgi:NAD(P)-dependent dehydrogenase (short-subunit alcohol dehydrogenase family)